jgi:diguanylate cyclase (GGDEF)-like protein
VSTLDLDTVLLAILTSAQKFSGMPAGSIALYDEAKKELTLHAHSGLTADFVKTERWEVTPGGLTDKVLRSGEVLFIEDTEAAEFFKNPIALNEGIKSMMCVPLVLQRKIQGILYLDDFVTREFNKEAMNLLSILGSFAAMAIANAKLHNRTKLLAITDALTGLHNHRYFQQVFSLELSRSKRYQKPLSLIMLDVDNFKKFNDTHGHPNGDRALIAIGKIMGETLRNVDFAFRYGGEEFVILLPDTAQMPALLVAERLRENIERDVVKSLEGITGQPVTVSVGVASFPENGDRKEELFGKVDELMYKAKRCGKNKVYYVGMETPEENGL